MSPLSDRPKGGDAPIIAYSLHGSRYLNITNRCSLRCRFCPKFNRQWQVQGYDLRMVRDPDVREIVNDIGDPTLYHEVVFCGLGESTQRLYTLLSVASWVRTQGGRVRLNTDGLANLVYSQDITPQLEGQVDALSISLNAQDAATYDYHCRPSLPHSYHAMLDFIGRARRYVPEITLTAIDGLDGVNIVACERIAENLGVGFRRRVLDQVG
ncbi:MAG TPA: radical SAM protein [Acidiferrobacteraceae bacterium]|nr:radical SAM protein [Acidiferrobacteraceae bacterium]